MTLDEAIVHCKEKTECDDECAKEYEQLLQWLVDYKELKKRDIPKIAEWEESNDYGGGTMNVYVCPTCGKKEKYIMNYCCSCGQRLWRW